DDLLRLVVDPAVAAELLRDSLAQRGRAGDVGVFRVARLDGADRRVLDVLRRVEVGLAGRQADHVAARRLQRAGLGGDGDRLARADAVQAFGGQRHPRIPRSERAKNYAAVRTPATRTRGRNSHASSSAASTIARTTVASAKTSGVGPR